MTKIEYIIQFLLSTDICEESFNLYLKNNSYRPCKRPSIKNPMISSFVKSGKNLPDTEIIDDITNKPARNELEIE